MKILLCELVKLGESDRGGEKDFSRLVRRIRDNPSVSVSLEEAAREYAMSLSTFKRRFLAERGQSFHRFQLEERVERACLLLAQEDRPPLKWIARTLGFCDEYYFSRVFKGIKGMSPGRYRERLHRVRRVPNH